MDPPEEDYELSSLMEETLEDDHQLGAGCNFDDFEESGSRMPSNNNNAAQHRPTPGSRGGRRFRSSKNARQQSASSSKPRRPDSASSFSSSSPPGVRFRIALLLSLLAAFATLILLINSKTENAIEEGVATGRIYTAAHHFKTEGKGGKGGVQGTASSSSSSRGMMIGFHDPSMENIYGANRYRKPKGAGASTAPLGGLHPVYVADLTDDEEERTGTHLSNEYYDDGDEDYESSPYADVRMKMTDDERSAEQRRWSQKLDEIRNRFGYWNFKDESYSPKATQEGGKSSRRPVVDWTEAPSSGEIDAKDFPEGSWQTDPVYVSDLLKDGRALVDRVRKAIFEEYGWDEEEEYAEYAIDVVPDAKNEDEEGGGGKKKKKKKKSVAWMYEGSMEALSKKLLRAMMTNDHFRVTLGGHSAAAGHGNNFLQSYTMEFQRVMEPVFDRLGMVLVSANVAQGGMGTLQLALAGSSIYGGRNDFVLWDSSMTEKDTKPQDVFHRQALMSGGERVPILFDMGGGRAAMDRIRKETGAHVGGADRANLLPRFKNATIDFSQKKYNAACWAKGRVDVPDRVKQNDKYGGQASWHPGNWGHQSSARKVTLVFLRALDGALKLWEERNGAPREEGGGAPLDARHWHLEEEEAKIREAVKNANASETECGQMFDFLPRMCRVPMRGAGEWTPRRDPDNSSIRSLVKPAEDGYVPGMLNDDEQMYVTRDPMQPQQRVPWGEVDVAAVARSLPPMAKGRRRTRRRSMLSRPAPIANGARAGGTAGLEPPRPAGYRGRRHLDGDTDIVPGQGWTVEGHPLGFCDGTSNSVCYREKTSNCLMSGHNDARGAMKADGLSGWLVLRLKDISEGIFMSRMESYHDHGSNARTKGWKTVNNATEEEGGGGRRRRGRELKNPNLPATWKFEVAVDGAIVHSWNSTQYKERCHYLTYNNAICVLWDDPSRAGTGKEAEDVEIAFRLRGEGGRESMIAMTHVYYA